nr:cytochrome c oxidase subunit II [Sphingomonas vulcanisoli]
MAGLCGAIPATAQTSAPTASAAATDAPATNAAPLAAKAPDIVHVAPTPGIGMPTDKISIQPQETAIGKEAVWFHNTILVPMMAIISLLVLVLLIWVIIRYRAARNPTPSRTHHNTLIEVIWTLAPVLVLICIAVPSIRLIAHQYDTPKADLTVKVIGNQWYWTYQYPDNGDFEVVSNMLPEQKDAAKGKQFRTDKDGPRLLAVDERMVVPVGAVVKIITTSNDVIHSFALPAAWTKMDAVPGRLNETWFKIDRPGVYFGQCSELCGARHGFMPIAVEVVSKADFVKWVAFKGGTMPGPGGAKNPDATSDASPAVAGSGKPEPTNAGGLTDTGPTVNATAAPAKTSQPAVAQN